MAKRYIDADALIPMMKYATTDSEVGIFPIKIGFNDIVKVINDMPSADVRENVRGEWIHIGSPDNYHAGLIKCPFCKCDYIEDDYNFCPNCGADMRQRSKNE